MPAVIVAPPRSPRLPKALASPKPLHARSVRGKLTSAICDFSRIFPCGVPMSSEIEGRSFTTSVLYWTGFLEEAFNREFVRTLRAPKVVVSRWRALSVLAELSGLTITELAVHSFIERSALSRLLTQLAEEGMVERRPRKDDRRTIEIHLTPAGRAAFEA